MWHLTRVRSALQNANTDNNTATVLRIMTGKELCGNGVNKVFFGEKKLSTLFSRGENEPLLPCAR
jgi:hypothetical protein